MRTVSLVASLSALLLLAAAPKPPPAKPTTSPAATRPAALDLAAVLKQLPKEYKPPKTGWDEFTRPKAHKWLAGQYAGKSVTLLVKLESAEVERIPKKSDPDETEAWVQRLVLQPTPVKGLPFPALQSVIVKPKGFAAEGRLRPDTIGGGVTEAEARQTKEWKEGQSLALVGEVGDIEIESDGTADAPSCRLTVTLLDCNVFPLSVQKK